LLWRCWYENIVYRKLQQGV